MDWPAHDPRSLTAESTSFTTTDGTVYAWTGLTVVPRLCDDREIVFEGGSYINVRRGKVQIGTADATITVTKHNGSSVTHTFYATPGVTQHVVTGDRATTIVQGSGTQTINFS